MAQLGPYVGIHSGVLKIYVGIWLMGSGSFGTFNDSEARFTGTYEFLGQQGTFRIGIRLVGDRAKRSGSCQMMLNGQIDNASRHISHEVSRLGLFGARRRATLDES
jgi:hypothetical protein